MGNISEIEVNITCAYQLWFYADDEEIIGSSMSDSNWWTVRHAQIPINTKVYGIKCVNTGDVGGGGILASFSDGTVTNGEDWRYLLG